MQQELRRKGRIVGMSTESLVKFGYIRFEMLLLIAVAYFPGSSSGFLDLQGADWRDVLSCAGLGYVLGALTGGVLSDKWSLRRN